LGRRFFFSFSFLYMPAAPASGLSISSSIRQ
jgi:hypothetical protein